MPPNPGQESVDRSTYIPPGVEQAIDRQMQQSLPPNLRQYVGPNRPAYIPRDVERSLNQQMQHMPTHLKQYAGAYMQQRVVPPPSFNRPNATLMSPRPTTDRPPIPDRLRRDHSMPIGEQHTVETSSLPKAANNLFENQPAPPQVVPSPPPTMAPGQPSAPAQPAYDFIMNPGEAKRKRRTGLALPGLSPKLNRLALVLGGVVVLVIALAVIVGALNGSSNVPSLVAVAQDQVELVHLSTNASQQSDISSGNQTFVATARLSLTSSRSALISYLKANGHSLSQKTLDQKISAATDQGLTAAESAGTFNQTFNQTASVALNRYIADIKTAMVSTKGPKGQALLTSDYNQAELLLNQLALAAGG